ncbi:MAG: ComEA family DNA-binding protein [Peptoniphilaceae bacterium]|nr:ComEA family DNA-binding protein [Peptoniphilaceae bacterium]MDY6085870.1 ComEA family DNA-binding protein [Peptoniphilaceae bacterium]
MHLSKEKGLGIIAFLLLALFGFWRLNAATTGAKVPALDVSDVPGEEVSPRKTDAPAEVAAPDQPGADGSDVSATGNAEGNKSDSESNDAELVVYVDGAVEKPGLYTLVASARVADAIEAAGGLTADGDLSLINPAMHLSDAMKITVPTVSEVAQLKATDGAAPLISAGAGAVGAEEPSREQASASGNGKVNINTASREALMSLPSIGEVKADHIIAYREKTPFQKIEDIQQVSGIGPKLYAQIEGLITVDDE